MNATKIQRVLFFVASDGAGTRECSEDSAMHVLTSSRKGQREQTSVALVLRARDKDARLHPRREGEKRRANSSRNERRIESDVVVREDVIARRGTKNQRRLVRGKKKRNVRRREKEGLREGSVESEKDKKCAR